MVNVRENAINGCFPNPYFWRMQQQRPTLVESVSGISSQLGQEDQSRFPVVPNDEIIEIKESAASKNTKRTTQTWLTAWQKWCQARNIDNTMECFTPRVLDEILTKFFAEVRKKDGTEYEPDSLCITQASLDRYLRRKIMRASTISRREFKKSQETLNSKAKCLRGKRPNRAQPYTWIDEELFWCEGKFGSQNGVALTNVNFKNLAEHLGFRGRQDHYNAYVEDFTILQMVDGSKVVQFEENPNKTKQRGLRNKTRST